MIIWIASYPKSGNTWIRSLLSAYLFSKDGEFNFDLLKKIEQFSPSFFNIDQNVDKNINYQFRISKNWIPAQEIVNKDKKIHLFKTHNALCNISGNYFTNRKNTTGAIYIIRDPRNVVTSLSHHYNISTTEALSFMSNKRKIIFPLSKNISDSEREPVDFNFLSDWSTHYLSWKNINFCNVKIVKYEDFVLNTKETFISVLEYLSNFIEIKINEKKINNAIKSTTFSKLSKLEDKEGFIESTNINTKSKKTKFFNLGEKNNWKFLLNKNIKEKIEMNFKKEMFELKYLK